MDPDRARQALVRQRAERMCQPALAAAIRAAALGTATADAWQATQRMRRDNQRMLAAARTGLRKIKSSS
ncbi:hypothetical protein RKE30_21900 [Streptomyces sp. Li-HN-5-11]|uniref:hypothetical protein n=1 Tax=Streptomyces sp. Li-HN-5-11 TaxID=3075432 RepID=UPI0028A845F5|nr:hypothetical protein [Streptomyces sp. Li-HN-5-11]WNM32854.1 hypothetical protein RKE30_21900 [Streptomyces sp. Li-HN-5-11]